VHPLNRKRLGWERSGRLCGASLAAACLLMGSTGAACSTSHGNPDPGGGILQSLRPALAVIPKQAHVFIQQAAEPRWDSCDGRSGTFGWGDIVVAAQFRVTDPAEQVLADADRIMVANGWTRTRRLETPLGPGSEWSRALPGGEVAIARLSPAIGAFGPEWDLNAWAPPHGQRASGC
jgi:hypothetical protein